MAAVVLLAAAAAVLLARSTSEPSPAEAARRAALSAAPTPPYDERPGRTPIPPPTMVGDQLVGTLPATGQPSRPAADRAVGLVLGRFCLDPAAYAYPLGPEAADVDPDWVHLRVAVFRIERGSSTPALMLTLDWTGEHYRWTGPLDLLDGC